MLAREDVFEIAKNFPQLLEMGTGEFIASE